MQLSQMFENALLFILAYQFLKHLQLTPENINKAIACFSFLYLVFVSHPWYNSSAFLCLLASMILLLGSGYLSFIVVGLRVGISKDLDAASTTILSLTLTADAFTKEWCLDNVRAAAKFLRTGGAY